jgi:hypothetical protein
MPISDPKLLDANRLLAQLLFAQVVLAVALLVASTMHPRRGARLWRFSMRSLVITLTIAAVLLWMIGGLLRLSN